MKKAFITGASRGIGRGVALVLAEEGYDIAFTYHSQQADAQALCDEIKAMGRRCYYYQATLERPEVPEAITQQAIDDLGGLDLLVTNAGLTRHNSILTVTQQDIDFLYGLNFRSYFLCAKVAASYMVDHQVEGSIIFISSTRGLRSHPEDCLYGAFKAGLNRGAESMALELAAYGIRVNVVAPGAIEVRDNPLDGGTFAKKIPMGRKGTPQEVGHLVSYLASQRSSYMTGNTIKVDGGLILPGMPEQEDPLKPYRKENMCDTTA